MAAESGSVTNELLTHVTDMVDDLNLVMMDREFDSAGVKDSCETQCPLPQSDTHL